MVAGHCFGGQRGHPLTTILIFVGVVVNLSSRGRGVVAGLSFATGAFWVKVYNSTHLLYPPSSPLK